MKTLLKLNKLKNIAVMFVTLFFVLSGNALAGWCQGKPLPEQKTFFIFETSLKTRIGGSTVNLNKSSYLLTTETGFMKNISPKKSVGGTFYLGADDDGTNFGIKFRYRYWLDKNISIDLSPGLILSATDNRMTIKTPSLMASASLGVSDLMAFDLHVQSIRYRENSNYYYPNTQLFPSSGTKTNWYMGIRLGSYMALASVAAAAVIIMIVASQYSSGGSYGW